MNKAIVVDELPEAVRLKQPIKLLENSKRFKLFEQWYSKQNYANELTFMQVCLIEDMLYGNKNLHNWSIADKAELEFCDNLLTEYENFIKFNLKGE